jgi:hypothetical protein
VITNKNHQKIKREGQGMSVFSFEFTPTNDKRISRLDKWLKG